MRPRSSELSTPRPRRRRYVWIWLRRQLPSQSRSTPKRSAVSGHRVFTQSAASTPTAHFSSLFHWTSLPKRACMLAVNDGQQPPSSPPPGVCAGLWAVEAPATGRRITIEAFMSKTQSPTTKLSDTQLVILSAAAQRTDHSLLPFPESLTIKGAALNKVVDTLCKRKLAQERRTINGAPEWRRDEDGRPLGLFTTNAGLLALGVEDTETKALSQAAASMPRQRKTAAARPREKARKEKRPPSVPSDEQRLRTASRIW